MLISANDVGGICLLSPTTTTDRPRPIAPTASATRICDASSNTTRSNRPGRGGKNLANESGLTSMHGMIAVISSPYRASSPRTGRPRRCLASSRCSSPTWPSPDAASNVLRSSTCRGIADDSSSRIPFADAVNREICRPCATVSKVASPVASRRSAVDAAATPGVERADGVVGGDRTGQQRPAGIVGARRTQRLELIDAGPTSGAATPAPGPQAPGRSTWRSTEASSPSSPAHRLSAFAGTAPPPSATASAASTFAAPPAGPGRTSAVPRRPIAAAPPRIRTGDAAASTAVPAQRSHSIWRSTSLSTRIGQRVPARGTATPGIAAACAARLRTPRLDLQQRPDQLRNRGRLDVRTRPQHTDELVTHRLEPLLPTEPAGRRGRLRLRVQVRQREVDGGRGGHLQPRMRRGGERGDLRGDRVGGAPPTLRAGFVQHRERRRRTDRRAPAARPDHRDHARSAGCPPSAPDAGSSATAASNSTAAARTAATSTAAESTNAHGWSGRGAAGAATSPSVASALRNPAKRLGS